MRVWVEVAEVRDQWRAVVNTALSVRAHTRWAVSVPSQRLVTFKEGVLSYTSWSICHWLSAYIWIPFCLILTESFVCIIIPHVPHWKCEGCTIFKLPDLARVCNPRGETNLGRSRSRWHNFLGAFALLRKATVILVMFILSSAWNTSAPTGWIFIKFGTWEFFGNTRVGILILVTLL